MAEVGLSVIIPSYRNPTYLDLCLNSLYKGIYDPKSVEVIVVLDGFVSESAHLMEKYSDVQWLEFEENRGQMVAHNTGVTLASGNFILIVNDDNVFPIAWDHYLGAAGEAGYVTAPNQIEPSPSIFPSFLIRDFGKTPEEFDYESFQKFEHESAKMKFTPDGQTWPLFMMKKDYMMLGGIDQNFPSPAVADWDFFMRCEMAGLKTRRFHGVNFYHFAGAATRKKDTNWNAGEAQSFEYFQYKWGFLPPTNSETHSHFPSEGNIRGVQFSG